MSANAKRSTCREGYRIFFAQHGAATLSWINEVLHADGKYAPGEPDVTERSAHHWPEYYRRGIHPDDYPALNRWEIENGKTPPEFVDPS